MGEPGDGHGDRWLVVPPPGARVVDTGAARWWSEGGGLVCNQSYVATVTAEHLRSGFQVAREMGEGEKVVLVAESGPLSQATRESRALLAGPESAAVFAAMAVVVRSPVARAIMNFFVRLSSPPFPLRMFTSADDARAWARAELIRASAGSDSPTGP